VLPAPFNRAKRKGRAMVVNPTPTTAYQGGIPKGNAVLQITFGELLRSCSRIYIFPMLWRTRKSRGRIVHA
jgi:hypothetical protein